MLDNLADFLPPLDFHHPRAGIDEAPRVIKGIGGRGLPIHKEICCQKRCRYAPGYRGGMVEHVGHGDSRSEE